MGLGYAIVKGRIHCVYLDQFYMFLQHIQFELLDSDMCVGGLWTVWYYF